MYQQITLVGNLGNDPEMRYTPSGRPVTTFSVGGQPRLEQRGRRAAHRNRMVQRCGVGHAG